MKPGIPFVLGLVLVACSASSADAPDDPVSTGDAGNPARDAATPVQDSSVPRDSGSPAFDAGAPDTYVPPVVQDSGNIPFPDAAPALDSGIPFPTGDAGNPLCAMFSPQCCTAITDPSCLSLPVILLQQFCCTP
jgi:hypothetical protein